MSKVEVIEIEEETAIAVFDNKVKLQDVLDSIAIAARAHVPDVSTHLGRKEIAANAYKVARSKTILDKTGKDIVSEWKKKSKAIDAERRRARNFLDALRDEVRQPLADYEAEQERIAEEERRKEEEAEAARIADIERREAELLRKEEEQREKERLEKEARERAEREEQLKKEAAERERQRIKDEQAQRDKEAADRKADKAHRAAYNNEALDALVKAGVSKANAKKAIEAIARGNVPHVSISY